MCPSHSLVELISRIRKRPTLFLRKHSVINLDMFIQGWLYAHEGDVSDSQVMIDFQEAVKRSHGIKLSVSWADVIDLLSYDEKEALDNFFTLFDEYLEGSKTDS